MKNNPDHSGRLWIRLCLQISGLLVISLLSACSPQPPKTQFRAASPEEATWTRRLCEPIAGELAASLLARMTAEIAALGSEAGIEVCKNNAISLTHAIAAKHGANSVITIKRTSHKIRNPFNNPDAAESEALKIFLAPSPPKDYVQAIENGGRVEVRYYKPVLTGAACLICHGPETQIPSGISAKIRELYPDDQAKGFREGEFRGVIRVSAIMPQVP